MKEIVIKWWIICVGDTDEWHYSIKRDYIITKYNTLPIDKIMILVTMWDEDET